MNQQQVTSRESQKQEPLTEQFLTERKYLYNVSPKTIIAYQCAFQGFKGADSHESIIERVTALRQRGLSPVSVNCYLRHMRAYWKWAGHTWKIPKLRESKKYSVRLHPSR